MKIKHKLNHICLLATLFCAFSAALRAQFTYISVNGAETISGYAGPGGAVTIAAGYIGGYPITSVGYQTFVVFQPTNSPTTLTISGMITNFGANAFANTSATLTGIFFYGNPPAGGNLAGLKKATVYYLPGYSGWGTNYGGVQALIWDATDQWGYTITSTNATFGRYFGSSTMVTVPSLIDNLPVTSIGSQGFNYSTTVTNVAIPASITNIGTTAFLDCPNLAAITVGTNNPAYSTANGVLSDFSETTLLQFPAGEGGGYAIPGNFLNINDYAFNYCGSLTNVTIPGSITNVGNFAFEYCTGIASISIPDGVTSLGTNVFYHCTSLQTVGIGDGITGIGGGTFEFCGSLNTVNLGHNVGTIGSGAFQDCSNLTSILLPASVTNLAGFGFFACSNLTSVLCLGNAPASSGPFSGDTNVTVYHVTGASGWGTSFDGVPTMAWDGQNPFGFTTNNNNTVTIASYFGPGGAVSIPGTLANLPVTGIGANVFYLKTNLTGVMIPAGILNIGASAFQFCGNLTNITIGTNVASIGNLAFDGCTNLVRVNIPNSVTAIGTNAFYSCAHLVNVTVGQKVQSVGNNDFGHCASLAGVYFEGSAPGANSTIFSADTNTLYYLRAGSWPTSYNGYRTVLWNPQVQTTGGNFGVQSNNFGFTITGTSNIVTVVEACADLGNPQWQPVSTNTLTGGASSFTDPQWTNFPNRFYRLSSP